MKRQPRAKHLIDQLHGHIMIIQGVLGSLNFYAETKWKRIVDVPAELAELHQSLENFQAKLKELESIPLDVWRER